MVSDTEIDNIVQTKEGDKVYSYGYIDRLREDDKKVPNPNIVIPQKGCQEMFLACNTDIVIYGGKRGGGKSWALLADAMKDCNNKFFNATIFRKEIGDLEQLESTSEDLYQQFGSYNKSKNDMTWNFNKGASVSLTYYAGTFSNFKDRFQGREIPYVGIDEITQMEYEKFKYIMTDCRNSHFIPNRLFGTCNPDPDCWVAKFIDWWIGEDGYPISERNGVPRYCFMGGEDAKDPSSISWGSTREEVYEQNKKLIDELYRPYERLNLGMTREEMFIKSATSIEVGVSDVSTIR